MIQTKLNVSRIAESENSVTIQILLILYVLLVHRNVFLAQILQQIVEFVKI
jgi:hypothetical protein